MYSLATKRDDKNVHRAPPVAQCVNGKYFQTESTYTVSINDANKQYLVRSANLSTATLLCLTRQIHSPCYAETFFLFERRFL